MKPKLKRALILLALGVVTGGLALNVLAYRHAYAMMHFSPGIDRTREPEKLTLLQKIGVLFSGVSLPRPHSSLVATHLGPECKSIIVAGTNGIRLGAWYCPGTSTNSLVILFHGYGGEKSGTLSEAKALLEMGCSVLLVDFRGSGESSESYTTVGYDEAEDVAAAVRYAQEHLPQRKVILYGQSMGAAAVLRAVHSCGVRPDSIMVEAVFDRLLSTVRHRFEAMGIPSFPSAELLLFWGGRQAGFNGLTHNPVDYARSVTCPILFLHGADDPRARLEEARQVFAAVPGLKRFREFPGIGHQSAVVRFPREWKEAIGQFLGEVECKTVKGTGAARLMMQHQTNSGIPPGCDFSFAGGPGVSLADSLNPRTGWQPSGLAGTKCPNPSGRPAVRPSIRGAASRVDHLNVGQPNLTTKCYEASQTNDYQARIDRDGSDRLVGMSRFGENRLRPPRRSNHENRQ